MFPDAENARLYGEAHRDLTAMYERLTGRGNPAPVDADPATTMLPAVEHNDPTDPASRPDGSWCEDRDPAAEALTDLDGRE